MASLLSQLRIKLAHGEALPALAMLGIVAGLLTSGIILLFRLAIEHSLSGFLGMPHHEAFEALNPLVRMTLPMMGALLLIALFYKVSAKARQVGISHVLERLKNHQGHMPMSNLFVQFFGGIICAISGQSTGREGPAVHLGAAAGSIMSRKLQMTSSHTQLLLACGVAAAISASFNTPIAGVIFAMEVIVMGYSFLSLIPVILASVTGALVTRAVYGSEPAFNVPALQMNSLLEAPFLIVEGLLMGALAAMFIWVCVNTAKKAPQSFTIRLLLIGVLNGVLALLIPAVMGIGYDTVNAALLGNLPWIALFIFAMAKLLITSLNLGLGQPGGAIGPMLFIGACAGGVIGEIGNQFAPDIAGSTGYYAMLGMAAMMSACLQAPLTALMTLLELTNNPNILLPAMLVVVIANLTASEIFKQKALFPRLLQLRGLTVDTSPVEQMLRQNSVLSVAEKNIKVVDKIASLESIQLALSGNPIYLLIQEDKSIIACIPAADVANLLLDDEELSNWLEKDLETPHINMMALPGNRAQCASIFMQANLQEALDTMAEQQVDCLTIHFGQQTTAVSVMGIVQHDRIHSFYRYNHQ
ncbi:chloride channel protein [Bermanella marisrubri]|uniref:Chloride channel protein EriC n=1 Tax=Bermanella marisrubri TaxID=207949 RepID=Q1MXQ9_9GAMM|nr:chloride channel protein [Bermanella marisrubri]EAT10758.1 Chloride channel protein EriC [Oceanobacter sp. RED65] [Bermanella marisrubri]QIZ83086.1 chloride channel protein [Bermanella marisrubri]